MTKMTDAFKKVFLGLGGDPKELAENNDVGDYIVDLESAIKEYVNEAATHELPTPAEANVGKVATVVSDGEDGYEWSAESVVIPQELPTPEAADIGKIVSVVSDGESGAEYDLTTLDKGINKIAVAEDDDMRSNFASITSATLLSFADFKAFSDFIGKVTDTTASRISSNRVYLTIHIGNMGYDYQETHNIYLPLVSAYGRKNNSDPDYAYKYVFAGIVFDQYSNKLLRAVVTFNNSLTGTVSMTEIT